MPRPTGFRSPTVLVSQGPGVRGQALCCRVADSAVRVNQGTWSQLLGSVSCLFGSCIPLF